ncbi:hypothetical protein [Umezawaea sp. Da 62-37]|uniref:hypothetical protein n=1 Tax=Umezawaea sp. Da 62-37 TaxID=3075927 RepID=UPI0028F74F8D|nr:hypothetical protein [Umezawaea sp. Da 62-37]WNV84185.1 hypothetical protein RM788_39410 [Umezawaea sp. Da 62-37]
MNNQRGRSIRNDLSGVVHGTVVQAGRITMVKDADGASKPPAGLPLVALLVVGVLIFLSQGVGGNVGTTAFPAEPGTRPAGATDEAVVAAIGRKLVLCASEVVLKPANCPQAVPSAQPAHGVRWELLGDPVDGAQVRWDDGRAFVRGNAVMTVRFDTAAGPESSTQTFQYQAEFPWQGDRTAIDDVYRVEGARAGVITKRHPAWSEQDVLAVVRDGFVRCVGTSASPMPSGCPGTPSTPKTTDVSWTFEGDPPPNANTRQRFDDQYGLIHVVGSYSAVVRRRNGRDSAQPYYSQSGTYDATVIEHEGQLRLVGITQE